MDAPLGRIDVVRLDSCRSAKPHGRGVDGRDLRRINGVLGGGVNHERRRPLQRTAGRAMGRGNLVGCTHHHGQLWDVGQCHLSVGQRVLGGRRVLCARWSTKGAGNPQSLIERWDGSAWSVDESPDVNAVSVLYGVACQRGHSVSPPDFPSPIPTTSPLRRSSRRPPSPPPARRGSKRSPATAECSPSVTPASSARWVRHRLVAPAVGTAVTAGR